MYINILFTTFDLLFILQAVHFLLRCVLGPCFSSPMEYVPTIRSSHCPGLGGHISTNYLWWPVYMWISISAGLNLEDSRPKQKFIASVHFLFVFFFASSHTKFSVRLLTLNCHIFGHTILFGLEQSEVGSDLDVAQKVFIYILYQYYCISIAAGLFTAPGRCRVLQLPLTPSTCYKEDSASPTQADTLHFSNKFIKIGFDFLFQVVNSLPRAVGLVDMLKSSMLKYLCIVRIFS